MGAESYSPLESSKVKGERRGSGMSYQLIVISYQLLVIC